MRWLFLSIEAIDITSQTSPLAVELSDEDKAYLANYITQLKQLDFFEVSKISRVVKEVNELYNSNVQSWKKHLQEAVYECDEERYQALLQV